MTDKKAVSLRLNDETIARIKKLAEADKRSVNNMIEIMIDYYLEETDKDKQTPL